MRIEDLIIEGKKHLSSNEAKMLLAHLTGYDTLELLLHLDEEVVASEVEKYKNMIEIVKNNYPIQYLVGDVIFLGNRIKVDRNVLIPRIETEDLVDRSIKKIREYFNNDNINIIDLGTGSGCIAISLKKVFPNSEVDSLDISSNALDLARINALDNNVDINFYQNDMCSNFDKKYDVIISNPPYIEEDSNEVEDIVLKNEPHIALFASNNGLYFYEEILKRANNNLKDRGMIIFEIGYNQGESLKELCDKYLPNAKFVLEQDMSGRNRFVFIYK